MQPNSRPALRRTKPTTAGNSRTKAVQKDQQQTALKPSDQAAPKRSIQQTLLTTSKPAQRGLSNYFSKKPGPAPIEGSQSKNGSILNFFTKVPGKEVGLFVEEVQPLQRPDARAETALQPAPQPESSSRVEKRAHSNRTGLEQESLDSLDGPKGLPIENKCKKRRLHELDGDIPQQQPAVVQPQAQNGNLSTESNPNVGLGSAAAAALPGRTGPFLYDSDDSDSGEPPWDDPTKEQSHPTGRLDQPAGDSDIVRSINDKPDPDGDPSQIDLVEPQGPLGCPLCTAPLESLSLEAASQHVNSCLDRECPQDALQAGPSARTEARQTTARCLNPSQASQSRLENGGSALSAMMKASHESKLWSEAASPVKGAAGSKRQCPFYKIIPGLGVCVDAFQFGAVPSCTAYFLSHFHSDHYIGLSSSWKHGRIYCGPETARLVRSRLRVDPAFIVALEFEQTVPVPGCEGVTVTLIDANHCPGSAMFLFETDGSTSLSRRILHCGDFRARPAHIQHPLLKPPNRIDLCYLDTTYLDPKYSFPFQGAVISAAVSRCKAIAATPKELFAFPANMMKPTSRILFVFGTYTLGKEALVYAVAEALGSPVYASPARRSICDQLIDGGVKGSHVKHTSDPREAQVHMVSMQDLNAAKLSGILDSYGDTFDVLVAFKPSGWEYKRPKGGHKSQGRSKEMPAVSAVLSDDYWRAPYAVEDIQPRFIPNAKSEPSQSKSGSSGKEGGSTARLRMFSVPYSEHSSFRELTLFCCSLAIAKVIPTVNVGRESDREKMRVWIDKCLGHRRRTGLFRGGWD